MSCKISSGCPSKSIRTRADLRREKQHIEIQTPAVSSNAALLTLRLRTPLGIPKEGADLERVISP